MKMVTGKFFKNFACRKCQENIRKPMEQEEKLCDEVETVRVHTYIGESMSAGGGGEAAETARTRCGWAKLRECSELLYGRFQK